MSISADLWVLPVYRIATWSSGVVKCQLLLGIVSWTLSTPKNISTNFVIVSLCQSCADLYLLPVSWPPSRNLSIREHTTMPIYIPLKSAAWKHGEAVGILFLSCTEPEIPLGVLLSPLPLTFVKKNLYPMRVKLLCQALQQVFIW
jgi:hypothetical protein